MVGRISGKGVGGEDPRETLAVDGPHDIGHGFDQTALAFGIIRPQSGAGMAAREPIGDGLDFGERRAVPAYQCRNCRFWVDRDIVGLEMIAGGQVDDIGLERLFQFFQNDVDSGRARPGVI